MTTDSSLTYLDTIEKLPSQFRVAEYPDGRRILQGGRQWWAAGQSGIQWEDLDMVQVDENGVEVAE